MCYCNPSIKTPSCMSCTMNDLKKQPKPPLGILPRKFWLKNRISDCIDALKRLEESEDWDLYLSQSRSFAEEIRYLCEEWGKYYNE